MGRLLFGFESSADPEHVAIAMAKVHPADIPRHVGGENPTSGPTATHCLVHLVNFLHPDRDPDHSIKRCNPGIRIVHGSAPACSPAGLYICVEGKALMGEPRLTPLAGWGR
jgi:hypothetical protein